MAHRTEGRHLTLLAAAALALAACGTGDPSGPSRPITKLPRELSIVEQEIVTGANAFGFDLFRLVHAAEEAPNVFLSPLSASTALGMALNGAAGETWEGMRTGLRLDDRSEQEINEGYRSLLELLVRLDPRVEFGVGNSVWTRQGFPVLPSFYDAVREYFAAEAQERDFDDPATLDVINAWIRKATDGMIEKGIDGISHADRSVPDQRDLLHRQVGVALRPEQDAARAVHARERHSCHGAAHVAEGELSVHPDRALRGDRAGYGGGAYSMVVVLPAPDVPLADIVAELSPQWWDGLVAALDTAEMDLYLPRFKIEYDAYLNAPLVAMGMGRAFSPDADFGRLTPEGAVPPVRAAEDLRRGGRGGHEGRRGDGRGRGIDLRAAHDARRPAVPVRDPRAVLRHRALPRRDRRPDARGRAAAAEAGAALLSGPTGHAQRAARLARRAGRSVVLRCSPFPDSCPRFPASKAHPRSISCLLDARSRPASPARGGSRRRNRSGTDTERGT